MLYVKTFEGFFDFLKSDDDKLATILAKAKSGEYNNVRPLSGYYKTK